MRHKGIPSESYFRLPELVKARIENEKAKVHELEVPKRTGVRRLSRLRSFECGFDHILLNSFKSQLIRLFDARCELEESERKRERVTAFENNYQKLLRTFVQMSVDPFVRATIADPRVHVFHNIPPKRKARPDINVENLSDRVESAAKVIVMRYYETESDFDMEGGLQMSYEACLNGKVIGVRNSALWAVRQAEWARELDRIDRSWS